MAYPLCAPSPQADDGDDKEPNLAGSAIQQVLAEPLGPGGSGGAGGGWGWMRDGDAAGSRGAGSSIREGVAIMTVRTATCIRPSARAGVLLVLDTG